MDKSPAKNPFDDITAEQVMKEAISQGVIKKFHDDLTIAVKTMGPYKELMEKTEKNILGANCPTTSITDSNIKNTKKEIQEVGLLSNQFEASISKYIDTIMATEGKHAIRNIIKDLAFPKKERASKALSSSKTSQTTDVGRYDESQPGCSKNVFEADKYSEAVSGVHEGELSSRCDEVEVPTKERGRKNKKPKISSADEYSEAMSAVHEGELSSRSDEIEAPTKKHGSKNKKPKIPSADKYSEAVSAVHEGELSSRSDAVEVPTKEHGSKNKKPKIPSVNKASKSMVEEKKKIPIKQKTFKSSSKACASSVAKGSAETDVLPKRQRKPNSRYGSK